MLTARQELILRRVVETHQATAQPVGSKTLAADPEIDCGPSTIRGELAVLEEHGLLEHPHTSAGRAPTDAGRRFYVDKLLPAGERAELDLPLVRSEVDQAMRATTETLAQVTDLLAIVSAPPLEAATVRHVEVLTLQPHVAMVVVITSTGSVAKRLITFEQPIDSGLLSWAAEYLNDRLCGHGLGARTVSTRLTDPTLGHSEQSFLAALMPVFDDLRSDSEVTLYVEGAGRLLGGNRLDNLSEINDLLSALERRVALLGVLRVALGERDVLVRIGSENELPALRSLALVGAGYGTGVQKLGTVSVIGPVQMDYGRVIATVREAASQLSTYIEDVYAV
ncbi:MAG: heat-inducible transcription repressor HrcA [Actinobacteria bacterium]|nr:heat-inducible transcription repressor HrcA [Actinomycetota bacterium]